MKTTYFDLCLAMLLFCCSLSSCSSESDLKDSSAGKRDRITELVEECYSQVHNITRAGASDFRIIDVFTQEYILPDSLKTLTRSDASGDKYQIHTVSLDFGGTSGFAVLSDTPGIDQMFFYTENGCVKDTTSIEPLKEMVESFPDIAAHILAFGLPVDTLSTRSNQNIDHLVRFSWHQRYPFNKRAPYCECSSCQQNGNHNYIGCVAIAVGQTMAAVGHFKGTYYGNRDINFDRFPDTAGSFTDVQGTDVSIFLMEVALGCQMKFGCGGSGTNLYAATNYMRELGYKVDLKEGSLDTARYIEYLNAGFPHIMRGQNDKVGHAWILDGVKTVNGVMQYHVNFGHGGLCNGWSTECFYKEAYGNVENYPKKHRHMYIGGVVSE